MKFSSTSLLLAASSVFSVAAVADVPCLTIADTVPELKPNGNPACGLAAIVAKVTTELDALPAGTCPHTMRQEIKLLAGSDKFGFAKKILRAHCRTEAGIPNTCTEWEGVVLDACTVDTVKAEIAAQFATLGDGECAHSEADEFEMLTGARNPNQAEKYVKAICGTAWFGVEQSNFRLDIDTRLRKNYMNQYTEGLTELNTGTGNFQGADNPEYKTEGTLVRTIGANINEFYQDGAQSSVLERVQTLNGCENQAIMCCFGRDRQVDNDGNCADNDCEDADPGDNSNLCSVGDVDFPDQEEGAIHCHGLAWSNDSNDPTAQLKYNNFFYVSMYDHMYKRGYVEHVLANNIEGIAKVVASAGTLPPMCGCIEDMPVVTRADCTQTDVVQNFKFTTNDNMLLNAVADGELKVDFNACQGEDVDGNAGANNDLASYVNALHHDGKLDAMTRSNIFGHLVGYADPGNNENEAACTAATTARK